MRPSTDPFGLLGLEGNSLAKSLWLLRLAFRVAPWVVLTIAVCTLVSGILPAAAAWVGRLLVDEVVRALAESNGWATHKEMLWQLVGLEASMIIAMLAATRAQTAAQSILKIRMFTIA